MKNFLLLILPIAAMTLNSCSKDDGGDSEYNKFIINGQNYEFTSGYMTYYGYNDQGKTASIEVYLGYRTMEEHDEHISTGATGVEITVNVTKNATKLLAGTYPFNHWENGDELIFTCVEGFADEQGDEYDFTGGTVTVAVSGNTYTIKIDCTLESGGTVKGTYKGELNWYDESE